AVDLDLPTIQAIKSFKADPKPKQAQINLKKHLKNSNNKLLNKSKPKLL
ncbi:797_t:CDS:2, partial [Acaulospora colombiana]